jgi:hypothetical protein
MGRSLWLEDGSVFCICCWPLPAQSFSGPSPLVLATIFYCLRFETFLFVASYDSQGHGGGIRPRLHTGEKLQVSVSFAVKPHLGLMTRYLLLFDSYSLVLWAALSDERTDLCFVYAAGPCQRNLLGFESDYFLKFETSLFVASYDSQGHGGRIRVILGISLYRRGTDPRENTLCCQNYYVT